jgi:hypothetical protein
MTSRAASRRRRPDRDLLHRPLKAGTYEFHDEYHEQQSKTQLIVQ